jgi:hypothetical protein
MQRFHGTAARQLVLTESGSWAFERQPSTRLSAPLRPRGQSQIRLMQKDMYAELTRRRRRAQIAARRWTEAPRGE